jgi:UDP-glucose 4-epimerase
MFFKNTILIIGGAGYIGSCVANIFLKNKYKVYIVDNLSTGILSNLSNKVKFYKMNISNYKKIANIIKKNKIATVIHLAAKLDAKESRLKKRKYFLNNVKYLKNILRTLHCSTVKKFIFASSAAVYKDSNKHVHENSSKRPSSYYGTTKLIGERLVKTYCTKAKISFGIIRLFNVVGADIKKNIGCSTKYKSLFNEITNSILSNKKFLINGIDHPTVDGTCQRDFIHVLDIAHIHYLVNKVLEYKKKLVLNAGYGQSFSIYQVLKKFDSVSKKKINVLFKGKRKGDLSRSCSSNVQLIKLGFKPKYNNLKIMTKHHYAFLKRLKFIKN